MDTRCAYCHTIIPEGRDYCYRCKKTFISKSLNNSQTDLIKVVRCKNCRYGKNNYLQSGLTLCTYYSSNGTCDDILMTENDYCSHGEKR